MIHLGEQNLEEPTSGSSSFQKTVMLKDWWLIKCPDEFEGKRFGVAGTELMAFVRQRVVLVFTSAPIVTAHDAWTLETSDGIRVLLRGFINLERTIQGGFSPESFPHFVLGFSPHWEAICDKCFEGESSSGAHIYSVSPRIDTESLGRRTVKHKATKAPSRSQSKEYIRTTKPGKLENLNKTGKSVKSGGTVKHLNRSKKKVEDKEKRVEEEDLTGARTNRKINFDVEATCSKRARKENAASVSPESSVAKRSRSGRLLLSPVEFWRNQVPVYDDGHEREIVVVEEGEEGIDATTLVRGEKGSESEEGRGSAK